MKREHEIIRISILGIVVNLILVLFKMIVGLIANSIAVILDAINNLTDSLSAIINIIGTKIACKKPDKKHPYGHGRVEYITSVIISIIILLAGITSLKESFIKIIAPVTAKYNLTSLIIIIASILTKFFLGKHIKEKGEELNSSSLVATGVDAYMDSVISIGTLIAAIISLTLHISLEGYIGLIIAIIIIKSSIDILKNTIDHMIGTRIDIKKTTELRNRIKTYKEVKGIQDLIVHSYGPSQLIASAHIGVRDNMTAREIHALTKKISIEMQKEFNIILTLGIYAYSNTKKSQEIKKELTKIIDNYKEILESHAFYVDEKEKTISFDLIIDFETDNVEEIKKEVINKMRKKYKEYKYIVITDTDICD